MVGGDEDENVDKDINMFDFSTTTTKTTQLNIHILSWVVMHICLFPKNTDFH